MKNKHFFKQQQVATTHVATTSGEWCTGVLGKAVAH